MGKMNMTLKKYLISLFYMAFVFTISCTSGHCRRTPQGQSESMSPAEHVFVYKDDGSLQCQQKRGVALEIMAKELTEKNIIVYSSENRPDGKMHIQLCGSPTGMINVYEISDKQLDEALRLGFKKFEQN